MNAPIFIDTGYSLALTNAADHLHERARATSLVVSPPFLTTEAVLVEIGNALSKTKLLDGGFHITHHVPNPLDTRDIQCAQYRLLC